MMSEQMSGLSSGVRAPLAGVRELGGMVTKVYPKLLFAEEARGTLGTAVHEPRISEVGFRANGGRARQAQQCREVGHLLHVGARLIHEAVHGAEGTRVHLRVRIHHVASRAHKAAVCTANRRTLALRRRVHALVLDHVRPST